MGIKLPHTGWDAGISAAAIGAVTGGALFAGRGLLAGGLAATPGIVRGVAGLGWNAVRSAPAYVGAAGKAAFGAGALAYEGLKLAERMPWVAAGAILAGAAIKDTVGYMQRGPQDTMGANRMIPMNPDMYARAGATNDLGATGDLVGALHNLRHGH